MSDGIREIPQETISGVALLHENGMMIALPRPSRHFHLFALAAFMGAGDFNDAKQGFATSAGRFVGREEAKQLVEASGQDYKVGFCSRDPKLYSEDLW